ncbi:MAG: glycosyltransferase family 2 protein [Candidatus Omnitrophota bacterium]|nr:glycosyltransferase family 2 protein [Candidatus Omnitrophota bacterium]
MEYPKISFLTPVYNEESRIRQYLENIERQDYPRDKIEVVIADGGSTDNTVKIASEFGCRIINNPDRTAEAGLVLCEETAVGDLFVVMAADNRLPREDWLKKMVYPFIKDKQIWAAYTHISPAPDDNSFNRYYSLLHVEPFTWFVYGNTANPRRFKYFYKALQSDSGYIVYSFNIKNHPLLAFAQGFMFRRQFRRQQQNRGDDILPFIQLIEEGRKIAYVPDTGVYHLHLRGFRNYIKKYQWRIRNSLFENNVGFDNRAKYFSFKRKLKKYLWILYGGTIIWPIFDSLRWCLRDKDKCWLWHIPASVVLTYLIVYEVGRKQCLRIVSGGNR